MKADQYWINNKNNTVLVLMDNFCGGSRQKSRIFARNFSALSEKTFNTADQNPIFCLIKEMHSKHL